MRRAVRIVLGISLAVVMVVVRARALNADPPSWLSWSSGIYTDEGAYGGDARSQVLFGHWTAGNFHGAIVSPPLYAAQLVIFRAFGPSMTSARMISVVFGLLTVAFLAVLMDRAYGRRAAWVSAIALGLSAPFVAYNRLALMETPVAFLLTAAFACCACCSRFGGGAKTDGAEAPWATRADSRSALLWTIAAGLLFAAAVAFKPIAWLVLPALIVAFGRLSSRHALIGIVTVAVAFACYWVVVLRPYASTLARMNAYYIEHQYLPHSAAGLFGNVKRGIITGDRDGVLPWLLHLCPVLLLFMALGLGTCATRKRPMDYTLVLWLAVPIATWVLLSYSPSRYFVIILPAMAGLVGIAASTFPRKGAYCVIAALVLVDGTRSALPVIFPQRSVVAASRILAHSVPDGSVVGGQFAPELVFGTGLQGIDVQPGLANDVRPIEHEALDYVAITRTPFWERWWTERYPSVPNVRNFQGTLQIGGKYTIDLFAAPAPTKWYARLNGRSKSRIHSDI